MHKDRTALGASPSPTPRTHPEHVEAKAARSDLQLQNNQPFLCRCLGDKVHVSDDDVPALLYSQLMPTSSGALGKV